MIFQNRAEALAIARSHSLEGIWRAHTENRKSASCLFFLLVLVIVLAGERTAVWASVNSSAAQEQFASNGSERGGNQVDRSDHTLCPEPRPQICTREYRPVCAQMRDGSFRTYPTGCTSCADPDVVGYRGGACE